MGRLVFPWFLCLFFFVGAYCALSPVVNPSEYANTASFLEGRLKFYWNITNDDTLVVGIIGQNNGWVKNFLFKKNTQNKNIFFIINLHI